MQDNQTEAKRTGIRSSTISALPYRALSPEYFLDSNSSDEAKNVVDGWRAEKISQNMPTVSSTGAEMYLYNVKLLTRRYAKEVDITPGEMHPTDIVRRFFLEQLMFEKAPGKSIEALSSTLSIWRSRKPTISDSHAINTRKL